MTQLAATAPVPAEAKASPAHDKKTAHYLRNLKLIALSYLVDGLVLMLFHLTGTISWVPVIAYTSCGLLLVSVTYALTASGWSKRLRDPSLSVPQTILGQALQLTCMALFPEVSFMFALILFIVYCSLTLTVQARGAVIAWVLTSVGIAIVVARAGRPVQIPDSNLAEQLISYGFFVITLWRCLLISAFNGGMTRLLRQRGKELAALTAQVDQLAHRDELTGVMNRRSLLNALRDELLRAERTYSPLCVGIVDLDKFKSINDSLGHLAGDKTLKIFAATLNRHTRKSDRFGRYGGEEFLLVMTDTGTDTAQVPIDRMRDALREADWSDAGAELKVTFSCGIAQHQPGETVEALLQRADEALYRAKNDGRDCTRFG